MPVIKIIVENLAYDSYNNYKLGEVLDVSIELAKEMIEKKQARKATQKELEDWEDSQMRKQVSIKSPTKPKKKYDLRDTYENVQQFHAEFPFFYDKNGLFWMWNKREFRWRIVDETDLMNYLDYFCGFTKETIKTIRKQEYLETMRRTGRMHKPMDAPKKWIQFKDKAYSLHSSKIYEVKPNFFFCNPIPWEVDATSDTPIMDKLITEWVGEKYLKTAYELIAYCCYADYPIHIIACLIGSGRNGKSTFQQLVRKFIGADNICSTELDLLLANRFESAKLYKKLLCIMGETNFSVMNKTSLLKKLVGQDLIGYEFKMKSPFDDVNYAKLLIASNSLPVSEDTSEGFYRRWLIIDFPNEFPEGKDILFTIPDSEYSALAKKVTEILPNLLETGAFTNQGTLKEREDRYVLASNPLQEFIKQKCIVDGSLFISYGKLYSSYCFFLKSIKKRRVHKKEFRASLVEENYTIERTSKKVDDDAWKSDIWIIGLDLKPECEKQPTKEGVKEEEVKDD